MLGWLTDRLRDIHNASVRWPSQHPFEMATTAIAHSEASLNRKSREYFYIFITALVMSISDARLHRMAWLSVYARCFVSLQQPA